MRHTLDARRALLGACLGAVFGVIGSIFFKSFSPVFESWLVDYPAWVLPAIAAAFVAVGLLTFMLLPLRLRKMSRGGDAGV
jgi:H+/Cl- antiporter ClcA